MLLSIQDLKVSFRMGKVGGVAQRADAVKGVSFDVPENSIVALVGESGSGKSVTAMSILNLLPDNAERQGRILWQGKDLLQTALPELQTLRGKDIACVFQDPMQSLNPVFTVGAQIVEPLVKHLGLTKKQALARAEELLVEVGMPEPKRRLNAYPHEMSGGQQQRVMIAMALACEPKLLIADEPTTALDVTIQRQILELVGKLKDKHRMSVLFISHDLGVVGEIADHVVVMRHGVIREQGPVAGIFAHPQDDYTKALLACRPSLTENVVDFGGRTGYVTAAVSAHAPIVPVVSIGGQETQLFLSRGRRLSRALGLTKLERRLFRTDILPVSLGLPFGLSVLVPVNMPLPSKIVVEVLGPIDVAAQWESNPDVDRIDAAYRLPSRRWAGRRT